MHIRFLIFISDNSSIQVYEKFTVIFQWRKVKAKYPWKNMITVFWFASLEGARLNSNISCNSKVL